MDFKLIFFIVQVLLVVQCTNAANILILFPTPSKSHTILGMKLSEGLLKRGHHITFASPFKVDKMENLTHIELKGILEYKGEYYAPNTLTLRQISNVLIIIIPSLISSIQTEIFTLLKTKKKYHTHFSVCIGHKT